MSGGVIGAHTLGPLGRSRYRVAKRPELPFTRVERLC